MLFKASLVVCAAILRFSLVRAQAPPPTSTPTPSPYPPEAPALCQRGEKKTEPFQVILREICNAYDPDYENKKNLLVNLNDVRLREWFIYCNDKPYLTCQRCADGLNVNSTCNQCTDNYGQGACTNATTQPSGINACDIEEVANDCEYRKETECKDEYGGYRNGRFFENYVTGIAYCRCDWWRVHCQPTPTGEKWYWPNSEEPDKFNIGYEAYKDIFNTLYSIYKI